MNTSKELLLSPPPGSYRTVNAPAPEKELTIKDLLNVLVRRRAIVAGSVAFFLTIAILICVFSTRRYSATAELQVQKESSSPLGLAGTMGEDGSSYSDALQDNITLQTQANILQSDSLALKVIRDLNLASTEDFKPTFNPVGWGLGLISPSGPSDAQLGPSTDADLGLSPRQRIHVLSVFQKNLKVKPIAGTRLIDISYLNPNPRLAAEVVNRLAQGLSDYNFQTRHDATSKTANYLASQLSDIRKQSEQLQAKLAQSQRDSGVLSLGGVDAQGREQVYSAVLDKLQQATTAYTQAQSNRIAKGAVYEVTKTGDPEAISGLSGSAMFSGTGASDSSLALIQSLRMQQATLQGQIAEVSAKFGPAFPKLAEMRQHLEAIDSSIAAQVQKVAERAKNDYAVAQNVEASSHKLYLDLKHQADTLNDKTIAYGLLRQEADQSRTLYETLFKQLKQAGVLADFHLSNISIVDPARVPAKPAKPNVLLYLAAALGGGFFFGCCGALLRDTLDNKIHSLPELEAHLGQTPLGVLPYHEEQRRRLRQPVVARVAAPKTTGLSLSQAEPVAASELLPASPLLPASHTGAESKVAAVIDGRSAYIESLRALRTSLLLSRGGAPPQVILVTSSIAAEGKSMLSANLATLLAQQGKKVLLVDGDLRRPMLHKSMDLSNADGLSSFLAGHSATKDPLAVGTAISDIPGLTVLTAGPVPPYPAELLGSEQMRQALAAWRRHFDFILIDGSPVLPVTDSVVLSTQVDFTLLVARYQMTERQSLERSYRLLRAQTDDTKIGIVLNAVRRTSSSYYQYYGYNNSAYYGSQEYAQKTA
jgi:capsular exopolysaccharide synthesis family protein